MKKIESKNSQIALNSSYPKNKLYANSPMLTKACRQCEDWIEKDILYTIGYVEKNKLNTIWFIYGDCYAADKEIYERIKQKISHGVNNLPEVTFSETKELGRVNNVDPLGITYLRVRGMWGIENPSRVFSYLSNIDHATTGLTINIIMLAEKYDAFPDEDKQALKYLSNKQLVIINNIKIKDPNNSAKWLKAKLVNYLR